MPAVQVLNPASFAWRGFSFLRDAAQIGVKAARSPLAAFCFSASKKEGRSMQTYFKLACGQQFDTKPELKAFIRGLELMRDDLDLSPEQAAKVARWIDDANSAKNSGAKSAAEHAANVKAAKKAKAAG
jgi:hypothetical protein